MTEQTPDSGPRSTPVVQWGVAATPASPKPVGKRRWPWLVAILAAFTVGGAVGASGGAASDDAGAVATPTPVVVTVTVPGPVSPSPVASPVTVVKTVTRTVPAPKPKPAVPAATIPGEGTYLVGSDLRPGTYRTKGADGGNCYWARLRNTNGELDSIIANGNVSGPTVVTIKSSDKAFETTGCLDWSRIG